MVGLGETHEEMVETFEILREHGVQVLTVGQYLRPTERHLPIVRYWHPDEFKALEEAAYALGFDHIAAGPLVRSSSYHADQHVPQEQPGHRAARGGVARLGGRPRWTSRRRSARGARTRSTAPSRSTARRSTSCSSSPRWAPNHHLTNPWRFRVLGPRALAALKEAAGPEAAAKLDRAPTLVCVSAVQHGEDAVADEEDLLAAGCATYALLLGAHARGLAAYWRTPAVLRSAEGRAALGLPRRRARDRARAPRPAAPGEGAARARAGGRRRHLPRLTG